MQVLSHAVRAMDPGDAIGSVQRPLRAIVQYVYRSLYCQAMKKSEVPRRNCKGLLRRGGLGKFSQIWSAKVLLGG